MLFAFTFGIDKDIIKVHNHENIELFCQDCIDIALKCDWCIGQSKTYHLVLKIAIADSENSFSFIAFFDLYLMIGVD